MITHLRISGIVSDSWCKKGLSHTAYLQLICFVPADGVKSPCATPITQGEAGAGAVLAAHTLHSQTSSSLTGTGGDVALLVFLRRPQARLTPVLGLRVAAGSLPAADSPAAVPAALRPRGPGRPAAVQGVAGDPTQAENVSCGGETW